MTVKRAPREILRQAFNADEVMRSHPPRWSDSNKRLVFEISCPPGSVHRGEITVSRWRSLDSLRAAVDPGHQLVVDPKENLFDYLPGGAAGEAEWHLNFAADDLFCAYGGPLFAQDEMQVAEHPALGAVREAMLANGVAPLTVEAGRPTPILVTGVERRCAIATDPDAAQGRPDGLYGNRFARASADAIRKATRPVDPPTTTNLIAIEAPSFGTGAYTVEELSFILDTACTGFAAAVFESARLGGPPAGQAGAPTRVTIHTGFWGCGAYGGNRVLMALLQLLAARAAGVDRLVFHTHQAAGSRHLEEALRLFDSDLRRGEVPGGVAGALIRLEAMRFEWGVGDGN